MDKKCPKCQSRTTKKFGFKRGKQRWKCNGCTHIFQNKSRKNTIETERMWDEYTNKRQTYAQLGDKYKYTKQTIQRKLDAVSIKKKNSYQAKQYSLSIALSSESAEGINSA